MKPPVERGRVLGECTNVARGLSNEPGNVLTPREFAERASKLARDVGLGVEVLDEKQIAALKMGLLLGVARGSEQPPRVIVLRHEPKKAVKGVVLGLVGKGITFDTGGISIKPAENMDKMKDDMSGGAAVLCAMAAMSRLHAPVRCIGVIPATENMPGGRAMKPGDILTSAEGKTVEVLNTDAEGRLILGDALWYARTLGVTHLVDIATLTGACVVALGKTTSGLFGRPESWVEQVRRARRAGRRPLVADARVRRLQGSAQERDCRFHQHRRASGRRDQRGALHQGVRRAICPGSTWTSRGPRGRKRRSRINPKGRPASVCVRSPNSRSTWRREGKLAWRPFTLLRSRFSVRVQVDVHVRVAACFSVRRSGACAEPGAVSGARADHRPDGPAAAHHARDHDG